MKYNIKGTQMELTDEMKDYVKSKLSMLDKQLEIDSDDVLMSIELGLTTTAQNTGYIYRAEVNLDAHGMNFRSVSIKKDIFTAIDEMKDDLLRAVKKEREKNTDLARKGGATAKQMLHSRDAIQTALKGMEG